MRNVTFDYRLSTVLLHHLKTRLDFGGIGQTGAHDQARAIAQRVHPEQLMGRAVLGPDQAGQFLRSQNHAHSMGQSPGEGIKKEARRREQRGCPRKGMMDLQALGSPEVSVVLRPGISPVNW